ncbi:probable membrane-associated kinase regulator 6 [Punica granatum]|uniref:Probable membrane-associated kinase regulator 6 n=1 Tax=Punica granatum TaxID=22663 RepID=A0A218X3P3_PUNGR|nr:probable membrane-associated kinase regulator 6 [Punica granatum]OWM79607.1 hypothetical protein CDL15_Pgr023019 [Punica granatum]
MDASQPLTIESFSYSWLVNLKPSQEGLDSSLGASFESADEASFIEMDPRLTPSKRFYQRSSSHDFKFDFPTSQAPLTLVHADELFSGGYVLPIFADPLKIKSYEAEFDSSSTMPPSTHPAKFCSSVNKIRSPSLRRCATLSKQVFHKYFQLFRPVCRIIRRCKSSSKRENSRTQASRNCVYPADSSPRMSSTSSVDYWRRSCDSDSSIYEAVLHCKRSFGK